MSLRATMERKPVHDFLLPFTHWRSQDYTKWNNISNPRKISIEPIFCHGRSQTNTDCLVVRASPCLFLCVLCGFARNSSLRIREFQKNCVSLQTSRRHGVPPCKHSNRVSQALLCGGTPHLLYKIHGLFTKIRVKSLIYHLSLNLFCFLVSLYRLVL